MPPQHPRSTLFPYTTLFRSANALLKSLEEPAANTLLILISHSPSIVMPTIRSRCQIHLLPLPSAEDRKSTRLNSSHVAISYAVFCLKKKNVKRQVQLEQ